MKRTILFFILLQPLLGFSDTLDYWSVHLNNNLIGNYNTFSTNNEITLNRADIKPTDSLYITYGNDHPCANCTYYYMVKAPDLAMKYGKTAKYLNTKMSFSLFKLSEFLDLNDFEFSVYDGIYTKELLSYVRLFKLKFV
jgi:hypothetical protein